MVTRGEVTFWGHYNKRVINIIYIINIYNFIIGVRKRNLMEFFINFWHFDRLIIPLTVR